MQALIFLGGLVGFAVIGGMFLDFLEHATSRKPPAKPAGLQPPKPSSWEGSAEQEMLHTAGEIRRWSSDRPY